MSDAWAAVSGVLERGCGRLRWWLLPPVTKCASRMGHPRWVCHPGILRTHISKEPRCGAPALVVGQMWATRPWVGHLECVGQGLRPTAFACPEAVAADSGLGGLFCPGVVVVGSGRG